MRLERRIRMKRVIDTGLVLLAAPGALLLGALVALAVRCTMGGPVLFRQRRIGLDERVFELIKFRTMRDAVDAAGDRLPDRDRLTACGRLLRRSSLDELPQLLHVLRGEMALVGPRPLLPEYLPWYREAERVRHRVRPGLTGAAQIAGRNALLWDERLRMDAVYAEHGTILDDVRILVRTAGKVLLRREVSAIAGDSGEPLHVVRGYPAHRGGRMRRFELVDVPIRVRWFADPRIRRSMNVPHGITVEGTEAWLRENRNDPARRDYVLVEESSGTVVAMMGTRAAPGASGVEVYVLVDPDRHGEGLGTSAMTVLLQHLRSAAGIRGAWLTVDPGNEAGVRLYRRLGFTPVGAPQAGRLRMELSWRGVEHG